MALKDVDLAVKTFREVHAAILARMTPEERLAGLTPEQIAASLPQEVRDLILRQAKQGA